MEIFTKDWQQVQQQLELKPLEHERLDAPSQIFATALRNYWIDSCCVALYLLVLWGKRKDTEEPLALRIAKGILDGQMFKAGGSTYEDIRPVRSFNDVLTTLLRQYFANGGYRRGYRARLDNLIETLLGVAEQEMVSGRVYSWYGGKDLESVRDGQILLLCYMATSDWAPSQGFTDSIRQLATDDQVARDMIDYFEPIKARLLKFEFSEWDDAFSYLRGVPSNEVLFTEAKERVKKAVQ